MKLLYEMYNNFHLYYTYITFVLLDNKCQFYDIHVPHIFIWNIQSHDTML